MDYGMPGNCYDSVGHCHDSTGELGLGGFRQGVLGSGHLRMGGVRMWY